MAIAPVDINVFGGINAADSEELLNAEVRDADNFLFERGESFNRPGLRAEGGGLTIVGASRGHSIRSWNGGAPLTIVLTSGGIFSVDASNVATTITGPGWTPEVGGYYRIASVNGVVLISSNTGGMIRWDPNGTTYTILGVDSKYRYVTSHLTRVIGAYYLDNSFAGFARRVGWSSAGDETVWTPAAGNSANFVVLNDCPDDITGVGVMRNIIIIFRRTGLHFANPTGIANPTYRFESFSRDGVGLEYPHTLAVDDQGAYMVGQDDVYIFDGRSFNPIGYKIRDQLLNLLRKGVIYHGFITRTGYPSDTAEPGKVRLRYHLFPMIVPSATTPIDTSLFPHFVYDPLEDKWSKHSYDTNTVSTAFYRIQVSGQKEGLAIFAGDGTLKTWDPNLPCESVSSLQTGNYIIGGIETDTRLQRVVIRHRDLDGGMIAMSAQAHVTRQYQNVDTNFVAASGLDSGKWIRAFCTFDIIGQDFNFLLQVPPGMRFSTNRWRALCSEAGNFLGDEGV